MLLVGPFLCIKVVVLVVSHVGAVLGGRWFHLRLVLVRGVVRLSV